MKLTHANKKNADPWTFDPTFTYSNEGKRFKPEGLWLSVDGDWEDWCENEGMTGWADGDITEFTLLEPERVLTLTTVDEILGFSKVITAGTNSSIEQYSLPWYTLVEHWAGIIIAPYQWSLRHDHRTHWYYSWDCASACIWDLSVLEVKNG